MLIKIVGGKPRPPRWPGVRWPPLFRFCQKRMLIQIAGGDPLDGRGFVGHPWPSKGWPTNPRPQGFTPMIEGVAIETPRL